MSDLYKAEVAVDEAILEFEAEPLDLALYILEQHLLEDGVKGVDKYQDLLGVAWKSMREAREMFK